MLISSLLRRAHGPGDSDRLAGALLDAFGTPGSILAADEPSLSRVGGLSAGAIADLKLLKQLAERLARAEASRQPLLSSSASLQAYLRIALASEPREQFRVLFLDKKNRLLRDEGVAHGTVDHAPVYPREVLRQALELSASALVLVHNHPSGDSTPSNADIEMTRRIVEAARVFDIAVHDHLVVGREGTASFRQLGLLR